MTAIILKRQFITDVSGNPIGVILPLAEFALVEDVLEQRLQTVQEAPLVQLKRAAADPLFMKDLRETMSDFSAVDAEWWEAEP